MTAFKLSGKGSLVPHKQKSLVITSGTNVPDNLKLTKYEVEAITDVSCPKNSWAIRIPAS